MTIIEGLSIHPTGGKRGEATDEVCIGRMRNCNQKRRALKVSWGEKEAAGR